MQNICSHPRILLGFFSDFKDYCDQCSLQGQLLLQFQAGHFKNHCNPLLQAQTCSFVYQLENEVVFRQFVPCPAPPTPPAGRRRKEHIDTAVVTSCSS